MRVVSMRTLAKACSLGAIFASTPTSSEMYPHQS